MKLSINPSPCGYTEDGHGSGGIWRVICAQARWLPLYGVDIVDDVDDADVVAIHAGMVVDTGKPLVQCCHGYYWTGDFTWSPEVWSWNNAVIEASRRAHEIIVPSEWVARPIRRDMRKSPVVIPHGIDGDEFEPPAEHGKYVLWGKPRVDVVSDPAPINELAMLAPDVTFWTTYGRAAQNVTVTGAQPHATFRETLSRAAVWLATARETGDIASREAMAYGVPVLGWNWGGTGELVRHRETGYLARPGDYEDLLDGLRYVLAHRDELGAAAREDVLRRFQWRDLMGQYAAVFRRVLEADVYPVDVSVIIPTYNYARFLPDCLGSVQASRFTGSYEVIVVDDASTDNTPDVLTHFDGLTVIRHTSNQGLCGALNTGQAAARGRYWMNLDADNILEPGAMQALYDAMQARPWVDVGVGYYRILDTERVHGGPVDVHLQLAHQNQVPSTCMMRARSMRRLGGYRKRQRKNEDAELWCRALSAGLRIENVTNQVIFQYRWHGKNKSAMEGGEDEPDGPLSWNFYYPWRVRPEIAPFAMTGTPERGSWAVRSYERPHVAVIIPCGPGHERYLMDALDSVAGQTYPNLECIVANDTGKPLDVAAMGHPWVRVVECGVHNAAIARNTAIAAATAPLIVPLDADDLMYPGTVARYYAAWLENPDNVVYADCDVEDGPGQRHNYDSGPWTWDHIRREAIYQDTVLYPKSWWWAVGGYPVGQYNEMWEDWLFAVMLGILGKGATYLQGKPWGVYRHWTSLASGQSKNDEDSAGYNTPAYKEKYNRLLDWIEKRIPMCRSCGKGKGVTRSDKTPQVLAATNGEDVMVIFEGPQSGAFTVNSLAVPGRKYRVQPGQAFVVPGADWTMRFSRLRDFRRVLPEEMAPAEPAPLPTEPPKPTPVEPLPVPPPVVIEQKPAEPAPLPTAPEPALDTLNLPRAILDKLIEAGFTMSTLRADILAGGAMVKTISGLGKRSLAQIKAALLG